MATRFPSPFPICAVALACLFASAQAAELGDAQVLSYVGQPLVADIELAAITDPAQPVTVRMASADVYRGANIAMHPVLAGVTMTVVRRDGRQFLHITSSKPVATEYVHLFLDLAEGGKHNVRAATLWLAPDPNPAPPPPPSLPTAAPLAVRTPPSAPLEPAPKPAIVLRLPSAAAACVQKFSEEQIKACSETDYKNGLLSAQIVELEDKVKTLQLALDQKAEPAATKPAKPVKKVTPPLALPKPAPKPEAGFPWLLVSGIVVLLAALGGGVYFFLRRRKSKSPEAAAADTVAWYSKLTKLFKRKPPKPILITETDPPEA